MTNKELFLVKLKSVEASIGTLNVALGDLAEAAKAANIEFDNFFVSLGISMNDEFKAYILELENDDGN